MIQEPHLTSHNPRPLLDNNPLVPASRLNDQIVKFAQSLFTDEQNTPIANWNDLRQVVIKKIALPAHPSTEQAEALKGLIAGLEEPYLKDLLSAFMANLDETTKGKLLGLLSSRSFRSDLDELISFLTRSAHYQDKLKSQESDVAEQSRKPRGPRIIDNLLLAYSYFSPTQETEGPWQALQILQISMVVMVAPLFLSREIPDLMDPHVKISRSTALVFSYIALIAVVASLTIYQTCYQPIPLHVKPLRNYTLEASEGRFDPLYGRNEIIEQVMRCWEGSNRESRQHPLLCGQPGVGKTTIFSELARQISQGLHPHMNKMQLFWCVASQLLTTNILEGSDEKVDQCFKRLEKDKDKVVILIDEIHKLWETLPEKLKSMTDGSPKAFPYFLGTTTPDEYANLTDPAIQRRFMVIHVPPMDEHQTLIILRDMARRNDPDLEVSKEVLEATYRLTTEKLSKYYQPAIAKRILCIALPKIRAAREVNQASDKLQQLTLEAENILAQDYTPELSRRLKSIELEKIELEKESALYSEGRAQLKELQAKLTANKKTCLQLALRIETLLAKNRSCEALKREFSLLYDYQQPYLREQVLQLEHLLGLPRLTPALIEEVIHKFIENEAKAAESR